LNKDPFNIFFISKEFIMTKLQSKMTSRRAVAPVIATLLLVAIAVVGGSIVFVFSQGFFSSAQISGAPSIESLRITGFDATDGTIIQLHDGFATGAVQGGATNDGLIAGERIAVYIQNNSVQKVTLGEIRFAGTVYSFVPGATTGFIDPFGVVGGDLYDAGLVAPSYMIASNSNGVLGAETPSDVLDTSSAEIQPGQQATLIIQLDDNVKVGRDAQFKLSSTNGAVFVGTVIAGQQSG
jgi:flagellin-like protein